MVRKHNDREIMVIIPVYNCKNYLRRAVESVISQPYRAIKILLVDDGSTDGSAVLCDELVDQDKRITVIHQKMVEYQRPETRVWSTFFRIKKTRVIMLHFWMQMMNGQ